MTILIFQVIEHFSNFVMDVRVYIIVFLPIYCGMALIPNFQYLMPFSMLGATFFFLGFGITIYYLLCPFPNPSRLDIYTTVPSMPVFCSIFVFAVHNMAMLLPLENSMKNPARMPVILAISMSLNACIYIAFGFFGYNKYMDACDTVIKNLPLEES